MNYLLNENDVLHSRFLVFFLCCANQTKFDSKKEKEYDPQKAKKWMSGNNLKKSQKVEEKNKQLEEIKAPVSDHPTPEEQLHLFLEEAHPYLTENHKLYKK